MNRVLYRRIAQSVRFVLADEGQLSTVDTSDAFIRLCMEAASAASGVPVTQWALADQLIPKPSADAALSPSSRNSVELLMGEIPAEDWVQYPELPGWMYQYMLQEQKSSLFAGFKKGRKADKLDIPVVTQLFTPEWIARYLAENTVGRLWLSRWPQSSLMSSWSYYDRPHERADQDNTPSPAAADPSEWHILDPACGCGHLLTAAFDVLLDIYRDAGIADRQAVRAILTQNIAGVDVDDSAVRICKFVLLLKAAQLDESILYESLQLQIAAFRNDAAIGGSLERPHPEYVAEAEDICSLPIVLLQQQYDVVITNPPYLGRRHMSDELAQFLDLHYPSTSNDLFAAFLERGLELLRPGGYHGAINQHVWMFLSGYEALREYVLRESSLISVLHLGTRAFDDNSGEVVQSVAFVLCRAPAAAGFNAKFWRLTDYNASDKELAYLQQRQELCYRVSQTSFNVLPGRRFAYELPDRWTELFAELPALNQYYAVKKGMDTGCNENYVRYWHEVPEQSLSFRCMDAAAASWFPYAKGGGSRRWYGNHYYVVLWSEDGKAIRSDRRSNLRNVNYRGRPGITWSTVSTGSPGFRLLEPGFLFDNGGSCLFPLDESRINHYALLAYLNSEPAADLLRQLNPTLNIQPGDVAKLPVTEGLLNDPQLTALGLECVQLMRQDWDELEQSWNFRAHSVVTNDIAGDSKLVEDRFSQWQQQKERRLTRLAELESSINKAVYRLLKLEPLKVTRKKTKPQLAAADVKEGVISLMSYAAGCMMDRYPIHGARPFQYESAIISVRQLLPRFRSWLSLQWGDEQAGRNMEWIAAVLGCRKDESAAERIVRFFDNEWYEHHKRIFSGKPLYLKICCDSNEKESLLGYVPVRKLSGKVVEDLLQIVDNRLADHDVPENVLDKLRSYRCQLVLNLESSSSEEGGILSLETTEKECSRIITSRYLQLMKGVFA